jgi:hypothetical protein
MQSGLADHVQVPERKTEITVVRQNEGGTIQLRAWFSNQQFAGAAASIANASSRSLLLSAPIAALSD